MSQVGAMVTAHVQGILGAPDISWDFADGELKVLRFSGQPVRDAITYVTIGLSNVTLTQPSGPVRQELLFACHRSFEGLPVAEGLACMAGERALASRPLLDGQIVGPVGWLGRKVSTRWFLMSSPRYFPDGLGAPMNTDPPTGILWLVPLTEEDAGFGLQHGGDALDAVLGEQDPDLLNLKRRSLRLEG